MIILLSEDGQDVAEYAVMIALVLIVMIATIRLIGANASNIFSQVASSIQ
jgi:Flp pilus assembly pilin Flp